MGCLESKIQAVQAGENYEESVQRPLIQWTGAEVETLLRQHPVLESYASTVLKVILNTVKYACITPNRLPGNSGRRVCSDHRRRAETSRSKGSCRAL